MLGDDREFIKTPRLSPVTFFKHLFFFNYTLQYHRLQTMLVFDEISGALKAFSKSKSQKLFPGALQKSEKINSGAQIPRFSIQERYKLPISYKLLSAMFLFLLFRFNCRYISISCIRQLACRG